MVPDGWEATQIGDLGKFTSGGTPSKKNDSFWGGGYPWISGKDLKTHYLETSIDTLSKEGFDNAKIAPTGASLVLVRGMTLLKDFPVGYATRDMAFNQDIKAIIAKNSVDDLFLSYLLYANKQRIRQLVSTAGHGTGRIDSESLRSFPVNLPPEKEQKKIAEILSTWDKAITTVEKLITNSQQQKKALMQQLLTGKIRLPGFGEKWKSVALAKLCTIRTGKKDVNEGNPNGIYPFYTCATVPTYSDVYSFDCEALLIAGNGTIGTTHYCNGKFEAYQRTYVLNDFTESIHVGFLHQFISYWLNRDIERERQHGAMPYIKLGLLQNFKVFVPGLEEQQKITSVLSSADNYVELMRKQLSHLKDEKTSLMQQLLTGKRRVAL